MTDRIILSGLRSFGFHGVFEEERRSGQEFIVDVTLALDLSRAGETDDLRDTVHYGEVADVVAGIVTGPPMDLIEAVAHRIAAAILEGFPAVRSVDVTVHKPNAPLAQSFDDVAVAITRSRLLQVEEG